MSVDTNEIIHNESNESEDTWIVDDCFETFELRPVGNGKTALFTASSECFWEKYSVALTVDELRELAKVASHIADKLEIGEK